ncbi:VCBS repeat-containing protein [Kriegella sp. EG-1]|nr:VCBS repeat-containing protein [Flavobacteriaceae bacterium EG-1]
MKKYKFKIFIFSLLTCLVFYNVNGQSLTAKGFKKTIITRDFISEGVATADLNKDGAIDIIAGYYWFEAPNWKRHEMAPSRTFKPREEYCESFLNQAMDVNLDGWDDVIIIDYPGKPAFWFENPQNKPGVWQKHIIANGMGIANESPSFIDIDSDGRLDILCGDVDKKQIVWLQAPLSPGETEWKRFPLSAENVPATNRFSHGIGFGDINDDGIEDVVVAEGWFEGTTDLKAGNWKFHESKISEPCSHMQVLDVNGDGLNDVVSASAHKLGVWWHEKKEEGFVTHLISTTTAQTHSSIMVDLNSDGQEDFLTGKRYLAHNGNDAGDADAPLLFWIEFTPNKEPYFKEHFIDSDSGAGLNIAIEDMNNDQKPDIIIANKNGVFLLENFLKE